MLASDPSRQTSRSLVALMLPWTFAASVGAAGPSSSPVTDVEIARAQRSQPTITDQDIENARRRHTPPSADALNRTPSASPRIDALPQPAAPPLDLGAVAEGFLQSAQAPRLGLTDEPLLLVFISLSMPAATLTRLVDQASRARAPLILRGLSNGSLTETVSKVQRLTAGRAVGVQIDPQAFDRYAISAVPAFVLKSDTATRSGCEAERCATGADFAKAVGDVSLDHALRQLARASSASALAARPFLQRLER
ncbi:type-F conjugative transfer system pilin assembly protein TrbC [Piscinibacter sakaiensis]|uniref:type-F conjugative transfer system pilin assembly protein TrbC n=1 Tax=Piscinibacter sakaiensis TaxID=1547922 RepID=UPI003AB00D65